MGCPRKSWVVRKNLKEKRRELVHMKWEAVCSGRAMKGVTKLYVGEDKEFCQERGWGRV